MLCLGQCTLSTLQDSNDINSEKMTDLFYTLLVGISNTTIIYTHTHTHDWWSLLHINVQNNLPLFYIRIFSLIQ